MYINPDGSIGGGLPPKDFKILEKNLKRSEPNMIMESKEEVIDTIAKKDFDKTSLIQKTCTNCPPSYLFKIKKGDPIQVIKTTNIGTLQTDVFYDLKKHNGQNFAQTKEEKNIKAVSDSNKGWFSGMNPFGMGAFSEYNLPKDVVEEQKIMEKAKEMVSVNPNDTPETKYNKNLLKVALIGLGAYIVYRLVSKKQAKN
jgi:hypothetical protein